MSIGAVVKIASDGVQALAPMLSVAGRSVSALSDIGGQATSGVSSVASAMGEVAQSTELNGLIQRQLATSMELQKFSTASNIEKSKHESRMAVIANIRSR